MFNFCVALKKLTNEYRKVTKFNLFVGSSTPFHIRVQFGPGLRDESPEDNLGMCLKYEQLPCIS